MVLITQWKIKKVSKPKNLNSCVCITQLSGFGEALTQSASSVVLKSSCHLLGVSLLLILCPAPKMEPQSNVKVMAILLNQKGHIMCLIEVIRWEFSMCLTAGVGWWCGGNEGGSLAQHWPLSILSVSGVSSVAGSLEQILGGSCKCPWETEAMWTQGRCYRNNTTAPVSLVSVKDDHCQAEHANQCCPPISPS
jgi:hypothetical protein